MSEIYSHRFIGLVTGGGQRDYLVPTGYTAVVRCIDSTHAGAPSYEVWVSVSGAGWIWKHAEAVDELWAQWTGRQVVYEGEQISVSYRTGYSNLLVSGYLLAGVPPVLAQTLPGPRPPVPRT